MDRQTFENTLDSGKEITLNNPSYTSKIVIRLESNHPVIEADNKRMHTSFSNAYFLYTRKLNTGWK